MNARIVLGFTILTLFPAHLSVTRAQEPTQAELTAAIKAHIEIVKKKARDHKFHASLGTFEGAVTGGATDPPTCA